MSTTPDPPRPGVPTTALSWIRAAGGKHRAAEDGHRLMWAAVAGAAVVVVVATLTLVLAGGADPGGRPTVAVGTSASADARLPGEPPVTEAASPTPTSPPSSASPAPRLRADPAKLLAGLQITVDGLMQQGQLRRNDGQELRKRLREVDRLRAGGDVGGAREKVREFAGRLGDLRKKDRISPDGYDVLAAGAARLAGAL